MNDFDPGRYFCAATERELADVTTLCRWPQPTVYLLTGHGSTPGLTPEQVRAADEAVCAHWSAACGIDLRVTTDPAAANIAATFGPIDGPMGVLGQSYLPCGNVGPSTQLSQIFDDGEAWTPDFYLRVKLHEVGHAIGLEHAPQGSGAVMEPYLTPYTAPHPWDVQQAQARYGPPAPAAAPPPAPAAPGFGGPFDVNFAAPGNVLFKLEFLGPDGAVWGNGCVVKVPAAGPARLTITTARR